MIGNIVGHAYNLEASPHVIPRKGGGGDPKYLFLASLLELVWALRQKLYFTFISAKDV